MEDPTVGGAARRRLRRSMLGAAGALALLAASCGDDTDNDDASAAGADTSEHDSGDHHHDHDDASDAVTVAVDRDERCDIGFNTAAFNAASRQAEPEIHDDDGGHGVDFTVEEFAEIYVDPDHPMADDDVVSPEAFVEAVTSDPRVEEGLLSGAMAHTLGPDNWLPMTDPDECAELADELERAREVADRYPTARDAEAAGYDYAAPFVPGIAAHYMNLDYIHEFDIDNPAMLLDDGDGPDASIVGLSFLLVRDEYPEEGFTGPNDHYHRHVGLCMGPTPDGRTAVIGPSSFTAEQCEEFGGTKTEGDGGYMSHVWIVPGCESDAGIFSAANPAVKYRGAQPVEDVRPILVSFDRTDPIPPGCGSGKTMDDPLDFDEGGTGPSLP